MKHVLIDTNALMAISQARIDIFTEIDKVMAFPYTIAILQGAIQELQKIKETGNGKDKRAAKLALAILKAKKIKHVSIYESSEGVDTKKVDDLLVRHSQQGDFILTQDIALKKKLTKPYLTIRQGKKIMMVT